jgi:translation initiation factor 4A
MNYIKIDQFKPPNNRQRRMSHNLKNGTEMNTMSDSAIRETKEGVISVEDQSATLTAYKSFDDMGLPMNLLRGIYSFGFTQPSRIQTLAVKPFSERRDILAQAQSGTGKTGTFVMGSLARVDPTMVVPQVLIISPTRELSTQIASVFTGIGAFMNIKVLLAVGGSARNENTADLRRGVHVVVGTPGRIYDLAIKQNLSFKNLSSFILDEADEMLQDRFAEQIREIVRLGLPKTCAVGLFSATMPPEVLEIAGMLLQDPIRIVLQPEQVTLEGIQQYYVPLEKDEWKLEVLCDIYEGLSIKQSLIYCNTRDRAEMLYANMIKRDFTVSLIHGDMDPATRADRMREFRSGSTRVMISTDLLSRGIDVQQVSSVINYDIPSLNSKETYIHRIGRSGRFGRKGVAISLVTPTEHRNLKQISEIYQFQIEELPSDLSRVLV